MDFEEALKAIQRARAVEGNHGAFKRVHSIAQNEFPDVTLEVVSDTAGRLMSALDAFDRDSALDILREGYAELVREYGEETPEEEAAGDEEDIEVTPSVRIALVQIRNQLDHLGRSVGAW